MFKDGIKEAIISERNAIEEMERSLDYDNLENICQLINNCQGKIIFLGVGKSGHVCKKLAATFSSTGTPSFFVHGTEACHGDLGMIEKKDIVFTYFIEFNENILQCEIVAKDGEYFTYIHEKTTPLQDTSKDLIYSLNHNERYNYKRRLLSTATPLEAKIAKFYALEKVFFQNNEIGEIVRNYILQSSNSIFAKV